MTIRALPVIPPGGLVSLLGGSNFIGLVSLLMNHNRHIHALERAVKGDQPLDQAKGLDSLFLLHDLSLIR